MLGQHDAELLIIIIYIHKKKHYKSWRKIHKKFKFENTSRKLQNLHY